MADTIEGHIPRDEKADAEELAEFLSKKKHVLRKLKPHLESEKSRNPQLAEFNKVLGEDGELPDVHAFIEKVAPFYSGSSETSKFELDNPVAKEFFQEARADLDRSENAFENKDYAHSTYLASQSVEKAVKSLCLIQGFFSENELKHKVSHKTPKALLLPLQKYSATFLNMLHPDAAAVVRRATNAAEERGTSLKIARIEKKEIVGVIKILKLHESTFYREEAVLKELFSLLIEIGDLDIRSDQILDLIVIQNALYYVAIVLFPHFEFTRYPGGELSPKDYVPGLGIVDSLPELFAVLSKAYVLFGELLQEGLSRDASQQQP